MSNMSFQRIGLETKTKISCQISNSLKLPTPLISSLQTASSPRESERTMHSSICIPISPSSHTLLKPNNNPFLGDYLCSTPRLPLRRRASLTTRALLSTTKEAVLKDFQQRRALKVLSHPLPFFFFLFFQFSLQSNRGRDLMLLLKLGY